MLRQLAEDRVLLYLLLISVMGVALGVIGIYLVSIALAVINAASAIFAAWAGGLGG